MVLLSAWWLSPITKKSWSSQPIIPSMPEKKQKQLEHNILFDCMGLFGQKMILYHMLSNVLKPYCSPKNAILRLIIMLMSIIFIHFPHISQLFPSTKWPCEAFINSLRRRTTILNSSPRCCWNWCRAHQLLCEPKRKFILVWTNCCNEKAKKPQKRQKGTFF